MTIREQLIGKIRYIGLTEMSRRTGIHLSVLSRWITDDFGEGLSATKRRLGDDQLDRIALALDAEWVLQEKQ